jgi:phage replication O-like protein O
MASPQKENGYTAIANEIMDALAKIRIPGEERQVLDSILRKTYGWNKCEDPIALSQFVEMTGLNKPHIVRSINGLLLKKVIIITQKGNDTAKVLNLIRIMMNGCHYPKR